MVGWSSAGSAAPVVGTMTRARKPLGLIVVEQVEDLADRFHVRAAAEVEHLREAHVGLRLGHAAAAVHRLAVAELLERRLRSDAASRRRTSRRRYALVGMSTASPSRLRSRPSIRSTGSAERKEKIGATRMPHGSWNVALTLIRCRESVVRFGPNCRGSSNGLFGSWMFAVFSSSAAEPIVLMPFCSV